MGFSNATMFRIAQRAGVTWGAMPYQFGDKDAIIDAVIDCSLEEFGQQMEGLRAAEPALERRVRAFTERAWGIFKGPTYRTILDILLHRHEKTERIAQVLGELWGEVFGDLEVSPEQQFAAQRFTFVMLSGIATESVVLPGIEPSKGHFAVLESTLLRLLRSPDENKRRKGALPSGTAQVKGKSNG
jgi:AcrR family transcriptional regulator